MKYQSKIEQFSVNVSSSSENACILTGGTCPPPPPPRYNTGMAILGILFENL